MLFKLLISDPVDTNTSPHHHFYDEDTHELIDCDEHDIDSINIKIEEKIINKIRENLCLVPLSRSAERIDIPTSSRLVSIMHPSIYKY